MDIDSVFKPLAKELIQNVFPTAIVYHRSDSVAYNPASGDVTETVTDYAIKAGVLSRERVEDGGVGETYQLSLWVDHSSTGLPLLPKTGDYVSYDGISWKVVQVAPTYSSKGLIASKLVVRNR